MTRLGVFLCAVSLVLGGRAADAAVVSISSVNGQDANYDLTNTYGTSDWAYWASTSATATASASPTNEKLGASLIGPITNSGGTGVRGSTSPTKPPYDFTFTDGVSPTSGTVNDIIGMFNAAIGPDGNGLGVQLNVTAPSADPFTIYVWGTAFQATASLTATAGAASQTDSTLTTAGTRSPGKLYTINVTPDNAGQVVNIKLLQSASTDAFSNVSLSAAAVAVPEPSALGLALFGILPWALRRRR